MQQGIRVSPFISSCLPSNCKRGQCLDKEAIKRSQEGEGRKEGTTTCRRNEVSRRNFYGGLMKEIFAAVSVGQRRGGGGDSRVWGKGGNVFLREGINLRQSRLLVTLHLARCLARLYCLIRLYDYSIHPSCFEWVERNCLLYLRPFITHFNNYSRGGGRVFPHFLPSFPTYSPILSFSLYTPVELLCTVHGAFNKWLYADGMLTILIMETVHKRTDPSWLPIPLA